jgi:hypothetical protein
MEAFTERFFTARWLATLLAISIAIHGIALAVHQICDRADNESVSHEIALGDFEFCGDARGGDDLSGATFALHLTLLDRVDTTARKALTNRRFRVQQDIEQLLRQARSGDFEDPALAGLKRQIQEQINETLGMRAVADVIITDLELDRMDPLSLSAAETDRDAAAWADAVDSQRQVVSDVEGR